MVAGKHLPDLLKTSNGVGKYGIVIFEDLRFYLDMDPWNREMLDKYCEEFQVKETFRKLFLDFINLYFFYRLASSRSCLPTI